MPAAELKARKLLTKLKDKQRKVCVCAIAHMVATNTAATAPIQFNRADVREDSTCVCAYVTFENEESFMNCLEDYKHSTSL